MNTIARSVGKAPLPLFMIFLQFECKIKNKTVCLLLSVRHLGMKPFDNLVKISPKNYNIN